ncbi:MAG: replicative DNA helicase [Meiothermus silvanus]|nr:replicative DNA helicase [Allomeiothermus silvanus]
MDARTPPHNLEAEASLLGAVLLDSTAFDRLGELPPEAFYRDSHRKIWSGISRLRERQEPVDLVTLSEELRRSGELEAVGGLSYLVGLSEHTPTAAHAEYYGRIVAEKWTLRRLIGAAGEAMRLAYGEAGAVEDILDTASRKLLEVATQGRAERARALPELLHETFDLIQRRVEGASDDEIETGFRALDEIIGGLGRGSLNVIAARPGMGKTALALSIARNVACRGQAVAIFSLEMPAVQLVTRMLCSEARIDMSRLRQGQLSEREFSRLADAAGRIGEARMLIDDTSSLTLMELRARARRLHSEHRLGLIVVDYLQLLSGSLSGENRQQEIALISRGLKGLARELNLPILALSQLSRAVEARPNKRPMLSDLRESGAIEQDSDLVLFLYRDEYYNPHSEQAGIAEVIVGKQRNGPTGTAELQFHAAHVRFNDLARDR